MSERWASLGVIFPINVRKWASIPKGEPLSERNLLFCENGQKTLEWPTVLGLLVKLTVLRIPGIPLGYDILLSDVPLSATFQHF